VRQQHHDEDSTHPGQSHRVQPSNAAVESRKCDRGTAAAGGSSSYRNPHYTFHEIRYVLRLGGGYRAADRQPDSSHDGQMDGEEGAAPVEEEVNVAPEVEAPADAADEAPAVAAVDEAPAETAAVDR
jgi:hypothetical protein